jgi:hypothetical protein
MTGKKVGILAAMLMSASLAMPVLAQTDTTTQPAAPAQNGNGGRRNFDPSQFRQRMMDTLKERLGASDDEFAAIQPKLEKVLDLQRDVNGGGMRAMFGGGRRNRGGGEGGGATPAAPATGGATPSAVQAASTDLQTTLDNKDAKPDEIKAKLDAFRDAKSKAKDDLTSAQKDLESVLTQRQEAMLVMMGLLN